MNTWCISIYIMHDLLITSILCYWEPTSKQTLTYFQQTEILFFSSKSHVTRNPPTPKISSLYTPGVQVTVIVGVWKNLDPCNPSARSQVIIVPHCWHRWSKTLQHWFLQRCAKREIISLLVQYSRNLDPFHSWIHMFWSWIDIVTNRGKLWLVNLFPLRVYFWRGYVRGVGWK